MEETDLTQWIDDYLDGVLSDANLKKFNERLQAEPEFEEEVKAQIMVRESLERAELKGFFEKINEKAQKNEKLQEKRSGIFRILAFAASVTILIGMTLFFIFRQNSNGLNQSEFVAQSFKVEVYDFSPKFYNSEDQEEFGLRDVVDSLEVQILNNSEFFFHYSFKNGVIQLYLKDSNISPDEVKVFYDPLADKMPYLIEIKGERYLIEENGDHEPLIKKPIG